MAAPPSPSSPPASPASAGLPFALDPSGPAAQALRRARRLPLLLLLAVAAVFGITTWLGQGHAVMPLWLAALQAMAEAAMVGALADWFAVAALFHRIPLPLVGRHTAIIPRNKDRIAENLAQFVRERFLAPASLVALMRQHDPARLLASWLVAPGSSQRLGRQIARLAAAALELVQDRQVERFLTQTLRSVLGQVDWSRSLAVLLSALTHQGRHQAVLDDVLARLSTVLRQAQTHQLIADTIVSWLKREHPVKEKMLPTEWLSDKGAAVIADALDQLLQDIASNPEHRMREALDASVQRLITRLQHDEAMAQRAEQLRDYLLHDEKLATYLRDLWTRLRQRLQADLADGHSQVARQLTALGRRLGQALAHDDQLRTALNLRLERWARSLAPEVSQFLAHHIRDTVQRWDAQQLALLIEQHIGKDLQYIRINGTVVGGAIGLVLFGLSHAGPLAQAVRTLGG